MIGKQVVEDGEDRIADIAILTQRQRQRDRNRALPRQPRRIVLEVRRAAGLAAQTADQPAVEIDIERRARARHQNKSSMSCTDILVRGRITNSRSSAVKASISDPQLGRRLTGFQFGDRRLPHPHPLGQTDLRQVLAAAIAPHGVGKLFGGARDGVHDAHYT